MNVPRMWGKLQSRPRCAPHPIFQVRTRTRKEGDTIVNRFTKGMLRDTILGSLLLPTRFQGFLPVRRIMLPSSQPISTVMAGHFALNAKKMAFSASLRDS